MTIIKTVLIAAGGTGGHVFPGIAVARELQARGITVVWLGTYHGLDAKLVPQAKISFFPIKIKGLRGKPKLNLLLTPFTLVAAIWQTMQLIKQTRADAVLGMGGYVSGPAGIAAWLLRKPLYIHEQNALLGLTNRYLSRLATQVFSAFPKVFPLSAKSLITGNPIRLAIMQLAEPQERFIMRKGPLRLLVLGGSQGAKVVNRLIPYVRQHFAAQQLSIWHQTGINDFLASQADYQQKGASFDDELRVIPFIDDMPAAYSWADLIICRAGASTVSELAAVGIASILIPFAYAVDNHQLYNADYLQAAGAAIIIQEQALNPQKLITLIEEFYTHRERLLTMAVRARKLVKPNATALVVDAILG